MKELTIQIRRMPEEKLKTFEKGRWNMAYQVSTDDFNSYCNISPIVTISNLIDFYKKDNREL